MRSLLKLRAPAPVPLIEDMQQPTPVPLIVVPLIEDSQQQPPVPPAQVATRKRKRSKAPPCCYQERCTSAGQRLLVCSKPGCDNKCHAFCSNMFSDKNPNVLCPLHVVRGNTTAHRVTPRDLSKHVTHLPLQWANRWASTRRGAPGIVLNEARLTVDKIREDTKRELSYFPRDWCDQYKVDKMHEMDFALVAAGKLSQKDLWSNFLALTRASRLKRMRAAKRRLALERRPAASEEPPVKKTVQATLQTLLPGQYIVRTGPDKNDRLVVRYDRGVYDGYYVHQVGSPAPRLDQFSIQVGSKGGCTLLAGSKTRDAVSTTEKQKHTWTLKRKECTGSVIVWQRRVRTRVREGDGVRRWSARWETIEWVRSDDDTLFTGRTAPRTPPFMLTPTTPHVKCIPSNKSKRPCACGHPACNEIATTIAAEYGIPNIQTMVIKKSHYVQKTLKFGKPRSRPMRDAQSTKSFRLQRAFNKARTDTINLHRTQNNVKALRGGALYNAAFNPACHYPVKFLKRLKHKARTVMSTTASAWGQPALQVHHEPDSGRQVLCVPQLDCETAEHRWAVTSSASEEEHVPQIGTPAPPPTWNIEWKDNIEYVEMDGNVQPSNWSGDCKYNFMNATLHKINPARCKRLFGWPGTFNQLVLRITEVWFPFVEAKRSGMTVGTKLTELEECLATLYFLKHASPSCDQTHLQRVWGITKSMYVSTLSHIHTLSTLTLHTHTFPPQERAYSQSLVCAPRRKRQRILYPGVAGRPGPLPMAPARRFCKEVWTRYCVRARRHCHQARQEPQTLCEVAVKLL